MGQQMAIENTVYIDFLSTFLVMSFSIAAYPVWLLLSHQLAQINMFIVAVIYLSNRLIKF